MDDKLKDNDKISCKCGNKDIISWNWGFKIGGGETHITCKCHKLHFLPYELIKLKDNSKNE